MRPSQKQITPEQLVFAQEHALVRIVDDEADLREALRSGIAQRTMEVHRANILRKLGVKTPEDIRRLLEMAADEKA